MTGLSLRNGEIGPYTPTSYSNISCLFPLLGSLLITDQQGFGALRYAARRIRCAKSPGTSRVLTLASGKQGQSEECNTTKSQSRSTRLLLDFLQKVFVRKDCDEKIKS